MCYLCDEAPVGTLVFCQQCGAIVCFDEETAYITESGDLYCDRCGAGHDQPAEDYDLYEDDDGGSR